MRDHVPASKSPSIDAGVIIPQYIHFLKPLAFTKNSGSPQSCLELEKRMTCQ